MLFFVIGGQFRFATQMGVVGRPASWKSNLRLWFNLLDFDRDCRDDGRFSSRLLSPRSSRCSLRLGPTNPARPISNY